MEYLVCALVRHSMSNIMGGGSSKNVVRQVVTRRNKVPKELSAWGGLPLIPQAAAAAAATSASDVEKDFRNWEFNIWLLQPGELITLSMLMVEHYGLQTKFSLDAKKWCSMMFDVQTLMGTSDNPYHNFYHVMDVTQACFVMASKFDAASILTDIDIVALLTSGDHRSSCCCHSLLLFTKPIAQFQPLTLS